MLMVVMVTLVMMRSVIVEFGDCDEVVDDDDDEVPVW